MDSNAIGVLANLAQARQARDNLVSRPSPITEAGINPQDARRKFARKNISSSLINAGAPQKKIVQIKPVRQASNTYVNTQGIISKGAY